MCHNHPAHNADVLAGADSSSVADEAREYSQQAAIATLDDADAVLAPGTWIVYAIVGREQRSLNCVDACC